MSLRKIIMTVAAVVATSTLAHAQTIREMAKANPSQPITRSQLSDVEPATLQELVAGATLVLDATLSAEKSYLSPDENQVFTDYQLVPIRTLAGRIGSGQKVPGSSSPLTLATYGGDLVVEGVKVSGFDYAYRRLHNGGRYLLFLMPFGPSGKFQLFGAGAFEINGAQLKSILIRDSEHIFKDVHAAPVEDAVSRIRSLAAAPDRSAQGPPIGDSLSMAAADR